MTECWPSNIALHTKLTICIFILRSGVVLVDVHLSRDSGPRWKEALVAGQGRPQDSPGDTGDDEINGPSCPFAIMITLRSHLNPGASPSTSMVILTTLATSRSSIGTVNCTGTPGVICVGGGEMGNDSSLPCPSLINQRDQTWLATKLPPLTKVLQLRDTSCGPFKHMGDVLTVNPPMIEPWSPYSLPWIPLA